jgi:hypothetical protein
LKWQVVGDRICLGAFGEGLSCFGVRFAGGQFALMTANSERVDSLVVAPGVVKAWSQSCAK